MSAAVGPPGSLELDTDLRSVQQARALCRAAVAAQARLETFTQEQIDAIVEAMAAAGARESRRLAEMAVRETQLGNADDKQAKNDFVLQHVVAAMRPMRTVGVLRRDEAARVVEIAEPVGVVAGIIPTTNPTSTALFKCLIAIKARCGIVLSPHPKARACIKAAADVMAEAAVAAGAPEGIIGCMTLVSMEGTRELMQGRDTDIILATGGMALVRAAYSAGKPAFGVGPGNVPAYVERTADVAAAVRDIFAGTTFDNGTLCSSEQAIVCDRAIAAQVKQECVRQGGHFLSEQECERLAGVLITPDLMVQPAMVGQPAARIAAAAGITIPDGTRVLLCPQQGVGRAYPLSHEKLSPVLAYYEVEDWKQGCERCKELLGFGGLGHSLVIHSRDDEVVLQFGLHKPASRILVNTVSAVGAVGLTTGLFPSMTLGCGSMGNNITSDNIGPQHLINVKRLAWGVRPFRAAEAPATGGAAASAAPATAGAAPSGGRGDDISGRVAEWLRHRGIIHPSSGSRGGKGPGDELVAPPPGGTAEVERPQPSPGAGVKASFGAAAGGNSGRPGTGATSDEPVAFVSEADVKQALQRGQNIRIGPRTIITPLARDLGEQHEIFRRR